MCGRYASSRSPDDLVADFEIQAAMLSRRLEPRYNVAPTDETYVVVERPPRHEDGERLPAERQLRVMRWGLVPSWAKDPKIGSRMINARMETVAEKPAFRRSFERRRAIVPADGYYEWYVVDDGSPKPRKQPFYIRPRDGSVLAMAGLYEIWRDPSRADDDPERFRWTCTVITTSATDDLGRIHDRMPLMLTPDRYDAWLDPDHGADHRGTAELLDLLTPAAPGVLEAYPVSTLVSNVRNDGPELIEPIPVEPSPAEVG